jgi:hypothetical protein
MRCRSSGPSCAACGWRRRSRQTLTSCSGTATGQTVGHGNVIARGLERAADRAGLGGGTFHGLRHTFASILIAQGMTPCSSRASSGTRTPRSRCGVYAHLFDAQRHAERARKRSSPTTGPFCVAPDSASTTEGRAPGRHQSILDARCPIGQLLRAAASVDGRADLIRLAPRRPTWE